MKKNILINLDGYQHFTLTNPLKKIIDESYYNFAFHCIGLYDKNLIKKNFPQIKNVFCHEEFFFNNFNKLDIFEYDSVLENLNLEINDIDRCFNEYSKYYFRQFLSKKKKSEISKKRVLINFKFYSYLFNKFNPNFVIHEHSGGEGSSIFWELCKKNNCKYYFFKALYFDKKFFFLDHENFSNPLFDKDKLFNFSKEELNNFKNEISYNKDLAPFEKQSKTIQKISLSKSLKSFYNRAKKYYSNNSEINYFYNRFSPILDNIVYNYYTKLRKIIFKNQIQDKVDLSINYIVVYLQVEPELSTYSLNNKKINFLNLIKVLSKSLPVDYTILVKEHPSQSINSRFRSINFFNDLKKINKVKICPINFNSLQLLKNSKFIVTGGGTIVFESIIHNIPSMVFGKNFYLDFKSIFKISCLDEIPSLIENIKRYKSTQIENEFDNLNYALNIKNSMLDGYIFLSEELTKKEAKKINDEEMYQSLKKFFERLK